MRRLGPAVLVAAMVGAGACTTADDGPPALELDRSACARCGMFISEPRFAAAYAAPGSEARLFDDIGCLLDAASAEPPPPGTRFWFHDADSSEWMDGSDAVFVAADSFRTPMGGGLAAYRSRTAAEQAATTHGGRIIGSLNDLLAWRKEGKS